MVVAQEEWSGENASIAEIERELAQLREASSLTEVGGNMRTSVMTHCVWVPQQWLDAAETTLAGMRERHPSRTILLVPAPDEPDGLDALVSVRCFSSGGRDVCSEVIELRLRGNRVRSPGSIVLPLLISDLPVFCRWRGEPRFDEPAWEQLLDIADRLVVDSSEWPELRYGELASEFDRVAVSDIAWARLTQWRLELAGRWPEIREQEIRVRGPLAEATLLRGWLGARLHRAMRPLEDAPELGVRLGGEVLPAPLAPPLSPSDLLSAQLDRYSREPVYEEAVRCAASGNVVGAGAL
jgi:glucose-6-phosphate dehydrogenase assembly protein OpcA